MAFKFVVFLAAVACANAGYLAAPAAVSYAVNPQVPAITTQQQNTFRSAGNLAQVSTYSKTIDTPFSSVSKSDVRVSNPGYVAHAAYAAPAIAAYSAPVAAVHAPVAAAPALAFSRSFAPATFQPGPSVRTSYAAPAVAAYAAPAVTAYASPAVTAYAAPAVASYAAPAVVAKTVAAPAVAAHGLLGVAYSAAPAVAHVEYHGNLIDYAF